ncbi:AMP-binding protein [Paraburkholderia solisilvae]|uniref:Long-chain-fatty-acid--CoA ligase FadD13 n=1 Tax=Paraburkholderia solisilvae TaxID=624376 RepID=A0A6J5ES82_9BURK|nr:AMP-binding protein [Paraburkholderia solisilvae]CAB3768261.1 Long-chain-fatty-acid--CoA ligase FadD13 [Paraburkholderia solisilvae]
MVFDLLEAGGADRAALHLGTQTLTRGELRTASRRAAALMRNLGVGRGDIIAVWLPASTVWLQLFFAAAQLGAVMVPVSVRFKLPEALHIVKTAKARVLVVPKKSPDFDHVGAAREIKAATITLQHIVEVTRFDGFEWNALKPYMRWEGCDTDLLCTFATSGTTDEPKLAVHTAGGIATHARNLGRAHDIRATDVMLCALALDDVLGFMPPIAALASGAACVLLPAFNANAFAAAIERYRVTHLFGPDVLIDEVLNERNHSLATWRRGGFPEGVRLAKRVIAHAWDALQLRLTVMYGTPECFAMAEMHDMNQGRHPRSVPGSALISQGIVFRIVDPESGAVLPDGQRGELQVRGYNVMAGYLHNPKATSERFSMGGWFRTGKFAHTNGNTLCYPAATSDTLQVPGSPAQLRGDRGFSDITPERTASSPIL